MFLGRRTSKQSHNRFRSLRLEELESREVFSNAILFIGNSYTALTNPETYIDTFVRDLAVAGGQPAPDIVRSIIYGSTLQEHANSLSPAAIRALLPAGDANWDYVVIQSLAEETSTQGSQYYFGNPNYVINGAVALVNEIHQASPNAKIILYEPWAKRTDGTMPTNIYPDVFSGPAQMIAAIDAMEPKIQSALINAYPGLSVQIAPAGDAWAIVNNPDALSIDGITHPNPQGALLAAETIYDTIYDTVSADIPSAAIPALAAAHGLTVQQFDLFTPVADQAVGELHASADQNFLSKLFADALGRPLDAGDIAIWMPLLDAGKVSRADVVQQVYQSSEYYEHQITLAYESILQRTPDSVGLSNWLTDLQNGLSIEQMQADIWGSTESQSRNGNTTDSFIQQLYQTYLGRSADNLGLSNWVEQLNSGELTSTQLAYAIIRSPESLTHTLSSDYQTLLNRPVDSAGLANWLLDLSNSKPLNDVIMGIESSLEFRDSSS
ncbi:DUF4214 domain-containing protein [Telmatocola sphagniphila]|uniref:DUF4214 domain-containing protein n=1 Tax=Telmatocola sphagniphila TaxID=1123043 RepID=A0A8E6B6X8_9BACT|nr:DUF4214 domain-containing protein [Telmatocola sphagniphila]QVL32409.1 DUF4214 domain-containing protein [Telmatocola sphagniphila]